MRTEHEVRALALTEVKGFSLPKPRLPCRTDIVIQVNDVPPVIQQVIELGLTVVEPNVFAAASNLRFTEQGFYDFDDQLIVLYETKIPAEASVSAGI